MIITDHFANVNTEVARKSAGKASERDQNQEKNKTEGTWPCVPVSDQDRPRGMTGGPGMTSPGHTATVF